LGHPLKKQALHKLVDLHQFDILLLHETMGDGKKCITDMAKALGGLHFCYLDSFGHSYGLISACGKRLIKFSNTFSFDTGPPHCDI
jgi:hypothetical protein